MSVIKLYPNTKSSPQAAETNTGTAFPGNKFAQDCTILGGTVSVSGGSMDVHILAPTGPFLISVATASSVVANPLGSALTDRVSLSIRNKSATVTVYFGTSVAVTADDTATGGWEIGPGEDFNIDLDSSEVFYLVTPAAQTAVVKILEIAST
jgi:hypothetical protein